MKAVTIHDFGGPETLVLREVPAPVPAAGQVLIAVGAAGVGLADVLMRSGAFRGAYGAPSEGFTPGLEVAGTVTALGEGVASEWRGRRVLALVRTGGYAEQTVAAVGSLIPLPDDVAEIDAVALGVNAMVAAIGLDRAGVRPGERVLVRGAAGGIGVLATQLAAGRGAVVVATTSSEERGRQLTRLGASEVVDRAGTGLDPVDVILDTVAGPDVVAFTGKLRPNGRMVIVGAAGGFPSPELGAGLLAGFQRSLTLATLSLDSVDQATLTTALHGVFDLVRAGRVKPVIAATLPLGEVELWDDASHAINGEFPERIAERACRFWDRVDG